MPKEDFYRIAGEQFGVIGPALSAEDIVSVFPKEFLGRDDLVQFYLLYNGGSRTVCVRAMHLLAWEDV
jgi:hypothetical protein